ncbi:MAG: restriction endonuclease subunit S, partial [Saprospiraceae bacterium]|nr:restriction endonuclease subunit S [Saprospiraceae bacterium]
QRAIAERLDRADALRQKDRQLLREYDALAQSVFVEMFGDPVRNEKGWAVKPLGMYVTIIGGGTPSRDVNEYFIGNICWATSKDIKNNYLNDTEEHVSEAAIQNSSTKLVPPGTLLLVVKSKILMHTLPVAISKVPVCFSQDIKGVIPNDGLNIEFLSVQLKMRKYILLGKARGVNTEGLTLEHLRSFPVHLPPFSLQNRFAEILTNIEQQKALVRKQQAESEALFGRLLQEAFAN